MERRIILAIALALLVMLGWSRLVSKFYPIDQQIVTEKKSPNIPFIPATPVESPALASETSPPSFIQFTQEKQETIFLESQAAIKEVIFKDYGAYKFPLEYGFLFKDKSLIFKKDESADPSGVTFVYRDQEKQIIKRFLFSNTNYSIELEIEARNLSAAPITIGLDLVLGTLSFSGDQAQARFQAVTVGLPDKTLHPNARKDAGFNAVRFLSLQDRYFCAIIEPEGNHWTGVIKKIAPQSSEISLVAEGLSLAPGEQRKEIFHIYLGPQDLKLINSVKPHWSAVMYFGTFDIISHFILQLLEILHAAVHSWGLAIIILSILIYFVLYPLSLKQMRSMKQMQTLQPQLEELKRTYKDNPQKLNKATMELYRQNRVNPFSGCLPMVLQIPIFFALYQALIRSLALKGASFLWIKDLSEPDRLLLIPWHLPILGNEINLLPILMTIGMFIQQKISTATTAASSSAEQQKLMMIIFPLMFGFIFYHMPAGLVLYWFINSTLMLIYQFRMTRAK